MKKGRFVFWAALALSAGVAAAQTPAQTYKVGAFPPPFGFLEPATGAARGYAVEVMTAVAADAGFKVTFVIPESFGDLLSALLEGDIDIAAGSTTVTPEREALGMAFTDIYARWHEVPIVLSSVAKPPRSLDEMAAERVAAPRGSTYLGYLQEHSDRFAEVVAAESFASALDALRDGTITVYMTTSFLLPYQHTLGNYTDLKVAEGYEPMFQSGGGVAVRREDAELLERLNASLRKLIADGTLGGLAEKWGVTPP